MKLMIDIDEQHFELLQMAVMNGMGDNAQKIIAQGTPIPDNATVCDIEQIRAEIWDDIGGSGSDYTDGYNDGLYYAIEVINKYTK